MAAGRHFVYLDEARTHEVHALVEPRAADGFQFQTTELPAGSNDPAEAIAETRLLATTAALERAWAELEERLSVSGTYYRADVEDLKWSRVASAPEARRVDLRAHEVPLPGGAAGAKMGFHHFHAPDNGRDALLISVPRLDMGGTRSILAELAFEFPKLDAGELKVLHPRLAPGTLRSRLVKEHIAMPQNGYAMKLVDPADYERAYGPSWLERTRETFRLAAARVMGVGAREPKAPHARDDLPRQRRELLADALRSPRVRTLRTRFLTPEVEARLVKDGEIVIRRYFQAQRRRADHRAVYDLAMIETSLLVQYAIDAGLQSLMDEEGAKLLRYVAPAAR